MGFRFEGFGFRVSGVGFGVTGLIFGVSGIGLRGWGLGFGIWEPAPKPSSVTVEANSSEQTSEGERASRERILIDNLLVGLGNGNLRQSPPP